MGEGLPSVDFEHGDLTGCEQRPEQHRGGFGEGSTVWVLIRRLNSLWSRSIALVVRCALPLGERQLGSPRLTRPSKTARHASLVSPPMFLTANSTFWPSSRTPSTTRGTIDVALRSSRTRATVPSMIKRMIRSSASGRAFQVSQSPFHLPPRAAHRLLADRAAEDGRERPAHSTRIGASKIGTGNQRSELLGSPLVSSQRRNPPFRCSARRGVKSGARHRDLHSPKGPPSATAIGARAGSRRSLGSSAFSGSFIGRRP